MTIPTLDESKPVIRPDRGLHVVGKAWIVAMIEGILTFASNYPTWLSVI